ncbi:hypothetical protein M5E86_15085 [Blautia wexlerae]|nr:hypothetical protein M5E86_15085 [Blautia wexlerae]
MIVFDFFFLLSFHLEMRKKEEKKRERKEDFYEVSDECRMVEGSRHPCFAKTMFQTGAALVVTQMPGGTVDWMAVGSAVIVAGVASLGTSLAGLPELEKGDKA